MKSLHEKEWIDWDVVRSYLADFHGRESTLEYFLKHGEGKQNYWARLSEALILGGQRQQAEDIWFKSQVLDQSTLCYVITKSYYKMGHELTLFLSSDLLLNGLTESEQRPIRLYLAVAYSMNPLTNWRRMLPANSRGLQRDLPLAIATCFCLYNRLNREELNSILGECVIPRKVLIPEILRAEILPLLAWARRFADADYWFEQLRESQVPWVRFRLAEYLRLRRTYDRAELELAEVLYGTPIPLLRRRATISALALSGVTRLGEEELYRQLRELRSEDPEDSRMVWGFPSEFSKKFPIWASPKSVCCMASSRGSSRLSSSFRAMVKGRSWGLKEAKGTA